MKVRLGLTQQPMILAATVGVWLAGGTSETGVSRQGARLYAAMPAVNPSTKVVMFKGFTREDGHASLPVKLR